MARCRQACYMCICNDTGEFFGCAMFGDTGELTGADLQQKEGYIGLFGNFVPQDMQDFLCC